MPRHSTNTTASDRSANEDDLLQTYARLFAAGEISWPKGLSPEMATQLEQMVREHRRKRLVALIASRIAAEIAADAGGGARQND